MSFFNRAILFCIGVVQCGQAMEFKCANNSNTSTEKYVEVESALEKHEAALLVLLGFSSVAVVLAVVYRLIRRFVFEDVNNLDSTFDAGGNVSTSLTAVTIASQLLWPADLQQSATVAVKYGLAGAFWYCGAVLVNLSLFPLLSFKFKTRAPGAKTYLQLILVRFGPAAHIIYCVFGLVVNLIILASISVGGIAVFQLVVKDASPEFCVLVIATMCASYTFVGGLGSTFYVSYFNALTTFVVLSVLTFEVIYSDNPPFGNLDEIYAKVNCLGDAEGNRDGSYFTFFSEGAMLFAMQVVFIVSSVTYCDQASWQSRIAAKPLQGALGFLLGGFVWFSVPATIGTVTGITYLAVSATEPNSVLSPEQIDSGIVSAYMAQKALGKQGAIMMLSMFAMLTMSTGSGEIMGISSIIVYDIYQVYIKPFRKPRTEQGMEMRMMSLPKNDVDPICHCPSSTKCEMCKVDKNIKVNTSKTSWKMVKYPCPVHGEFRAYQDSLISVKNWCLLWVTIAFVPFGLILHAIGLNLNWLMLTGIIFTTPSVPGVFLTILWIKTTKLGLIIGSMVGLVCGLTSTLLVASLRYNIDDDFLLATSEPYAVLAGSTTSFAVSLLLNVLISLKTSHIKTTDAGNQEWQKLRDIDNPLRPWTSHYAEEFPQYADGVRRPTFEELDAYARPGRLVSIIGSIVFFCVFIIFLPSCMASLGVLKDYEFKVWATFISILCFFMAVVIAVVTPVEEIRAAINQLRRKKNLRKTRNKTSYVYDNPAQNINENTTPSRGYDEYSHDIRTSNDD